MKKPKFKLSKEDTVRFHEDCLTAAYECPQFRSYHIPFETSDILLKEVSAKDVVKFWRKYDTLWEYGYFNYLSNFVYDVLSKYELYKAQKVIWKCRKP